MSLTEISRVTHINRPALYSLLPKLEHDGLVSRIQKQKRVYYHAESPKRIVSRYNEEHVDIIERLETLSDTYENSHHSRPLIKYFEGAKGVTFYF